MAEPCGRGICAANEGHEGTCAEASGWTTGLVSNQERVARAIDGLDWASQHGGIDPSNEQIAAAAIDALADVDGIAGVLRKHYASRWNDERARYECTCGEAAWRAHSQHQAAAVVAWMKDQGASDRG